MKYLLLAGILLSSILCGAQPMNDKVRIEEIFADKSVHVWVFAGNSITQGAKHTHGMRSYPEIFAERVRGEMGRFTDVIINTAISGQTSLNILNDFEQRIARFHPDVVFLMVGTNDAAVKNNITVKQFEDNVQQLIDKIRTLHAVPVLLTPNTIITEKAPERQSLVYYVVKIREIAEKNNVILVDNWRIWYSDLPDKYLGGIFKELLNDPLHPNGQGHKEIAFALFRKLSIFDAIFPTCGGEYYEGEH
jgi:lysophospholipase L1-like esterase